jgi:hypothetical protein
MNLANSYRKQIPVSKIKPEDVNVYNKLEESVADNQLEEVQVTPIEHPDYEYRYVDGRRRGEALRNVDPNHELWVLVRDIESEKELHLAALIGNAGKPNIPDEAVHCAYLRDECEMSIKDISDATTLDYQVVRLRLQAYDNLCPELFELYKQGKLAQFAVKEIITMDENRQADLVEAIDKGMKPTSKNVHQFKKTEETLSQQEIEKLFTVPKSHETISISADDAEELFNGEVIEITYKGQTIKVRKDE